MKNLLVIVAALALTACANHPVLRNVGIGIGSALVIGAAAQHHNADREAQPDKRAPRDPSPEERK